MGSNKENQWERSYSQFEKVCSPLRKKSLFDWLSNAYKFLYLPSVDQEYLHTLVDLKTMLCIIDVAVDDSCDNADMIKRAGGEKFTYGILGSLYNIDDVLDGTARKPQIQNEYGKEYAVVLASILADMSALLKTLPRFAEFHGDFVLSFRNVCHAMEFSYLVNKGDSIYPFSYIVEHRAPSTMVTVHSILDLMASPAFDRREFGKILPLFNAADVVAMLSNTLNTWPREILERDYSSPVLALALERGLITFDEFYGVPAEVERKLAPLSGIIESMIDEKLEKMRGYVKNNNIGSFDAPKYVENYLRIKEAFKARDRYWEK